MRQPDLDVNFANEASASIMRLVKLVRYYASKDDFHKIAAMTDPEILSAIVDIASSPSRSMTMNIVGGEGKVWIIRKEKANMGPFVVPLKGGDFRGNWYVNLLE